MRKHKKKHKVFVVFKDLEKTDNRVNRETLWQVQKICYVDGKLLNGIISNSL